MSLRPLYFLVCIFFLVLPLSARQINNAGYALVMLGDASGLETGWTNHADYQELSLNARSNNMVLLDDKPPASNRKASYIAASGVSVEFNGMAPYKTYTMWIDFVSYSYSKNPGIYSRLQVFADGRQIDEIVWGEYDHNSLYALELPLDLTYDGHVVVQFKEASMQYGNWGIWDIVLASGELPKGATLDVVSPATVSDTKTPVAERSSDTEKQAVSRDTQAGKQKTEAAKKPVPKKKTPKVPETRNTVNAPQAPATPDIRTPDIPSVDEPLVPGPVPPTVPTMPREQR